MEEWRSKYSSLEIQGPRVVEKRVEIPVEVFREKVVVDENKVAQLAYEIERLKQIVDLRTRELEEWRSKYSSLEIKINEFRGGEGRLYEYENRIAMLSTEIERLNSFIVKLKSDNQELSLKISNSFEYDNKIAMMASEIERLSASIRNLREENQDLNLKISQTRNSDSRVFEYENRMAMLASEMERLNGIIRSITEENQRLNLKITQFGSSEIDLDIRRIKDECDEKLVKLTSEIERLTIKLREYEDKIVMLASENERLRRMR